MDKMEVLKFCFILPLLRLVSASDCGGCWCINYTDPCPAWEPQTNWTQEEISLFASQVALNPYTLDCNPYSLPSCMTDPPQSDLENPDAVCGLLYCNSTCQTYTMQTFANMDSALGHGAFVTHMRACGVCSTTQDLSVYIEYPDLTSAGKKCGTLGLLDEDLGLECFLSLGFTLPCAKIWNYDAIFDAGIRNDSRKGEAVSGGLCKMRKHYDHG